MDERRQWGRSRRSVLARSALGEFGERRDRPDPVALLESQATSRIAQLVPIRYGRMLSSPLAFFRGAALVMASDLAAHPDTGLRAQLCGDAHLYNFGLFGSPERNLVFDINDFDETLPGPWEWDLKRLASSLAVSARGEGFPQLHRQRVVRACVRAYRERMHVLAGMRELDVWYCETRIDDALHASVSPKDDEEIRRAADEARSRDNLKALSTLTRPVDGRRELVSDPPLLVPIGELVGDSEAKAYEQKMAALIDARR